MSKGKGTRIRVVLECNSCIRNDINRNHRAFPDILLKRIDTYTESIRIKKILSLLLQAYDSWEIKK
ncbi:hypothetical protein GIB67_030706 [Kingdonia uniflora]|uniref:Ribosomal protein L33 n=1 Tax=Kingdonia uniflora TaxID=39325 RepID=A0A7J7KVC5_9MAGN|nr:hypothetical protein GIB67_030706 [Kingdonia uniflora]